jgi:putative ABC transport system permease protein
VTAPLRALVRLYPAAFRERFGDEVAEQVEVEYRAARRRGRRVAFCTALAIAWDLVLTAAAERVRPTWRSTRPPSTEDGRMSSLRTWARELRLASRALRRTPGFAAVATGTLGLAIGVNAGMFSVVDAVLLRPLPYAHADRLVHVAATAPGSGFPDEFGVGAEFYLAYRESPLVEDATTYNSFTNTLRVGDRVERVRMSWPTHTFFSTLGVRPILGRTPVPEDEERVVVISHALWQSWLGGDPSVVGRTVEVSGAPRTIIGVMGPGFVFPASGPLLWLSTVIRPAGLEPGNFNGPMLVRVKPGVTPEALARDLTARSKRFPERFGGSADYARLMGQHSAVVRPLRAELLGAVARPLWVLLAAVGVVLVIACTNVANLFAVRAEWRQRDLAVRRAIGATRGQLVQTQMAEAVLVAAVAAALSLVLAALTLPTFLRAAPEDMPRIAEAGLGARTVLFALGASVLAALVCGLVPALRASAPDLTRLREGGRGATHGPRWGRDGLVVGQTALALVLLVGASLLVRSFSALRRVDPGYDTRDVFTFQIAPESPTLKDGPSFARFDLAFLDRLAALPGVESVGLVENVPLNEGTRTSRFRTEAAGGATRAGADEGTVLNLTWAAGDYFRTMGISVRRGRTFAREDHLQGLPNVIVSEKTASLLWPGQDPIGRRLRRGRDSVWYSVVGVVEDVMQNDFRHAPDPLVYFPLSSPTPDSWAISSPAYVIKTRRAETIAPEVRALVREVAPSAPMYRVFTMAGLARDSMVQLSFTMLTLAIVSALALVLGAVGLYGVLSYVVAQRTREIGVRMALGAEAGQVRRMVVVQGARIVALGVAIGVGTALASTRALDSLLYGVQRADAAAFVGTAAAMLVVGLLASYVPARRASRIDPMESLRGE